MRKMRRVAWVLSVIVCASGATAAPAATIYFQDNFEDEPVSSASGAEPIGPLKIKGRRDPVDTYRIPSAHGKAGD